MVAKRLMRQLVYCTLLAADKIVDYKGLAIPHRLKRVSDFDVFWCHRIGPMP